MVLPVTWKSTAFVSGAGLLATWLASVPSSTPGLRTAATSAVPAATVRARSQTDSTIEHEAARLARRAQRLPASGVPTRNPFRFTATARNPRATSDSTPAVVSAPPAVVAPAPAMHLAGVAMDHVDGKDVWTAILSTPRGVVLAREGEIVGGGLAVSAIGADRVDLRRPDGSMLTLPLSGK